jgi:light-regulated signal transduction histidine kinase (bacteriophytochrome)
LNEKSQELDKNAKLLEAKNKELETFTYSVSHDLKAPLRGIDGYSKLLQDSYKNQLDEEANIFLTNIRESALKMNELINDLLEYSRLERSEIRMGKIKIKQLITSLASIYTKELKSGGFSLDININETKIEADTKGISIALRNLIENSIKFTCEKENPEISISIRENDNAWVLSVKDNGIGFDMKYSTKIFDIFQRLHRIEDYPGTGIGLAMVSKAMHRMNGKVWATSMPGKGSTFYLQIPKTTNYAD